MSIQSDTPETDAVIGGADVWNAFEEDIIALARKLERERNEWQKLAAQYSREREHNAMQALSYEAERNDLRRLVKKLEGQLTSALGEIVKAHDTKQPTRETPDKLD